MRFLVDTSEKKPWPAPKHREMIRGNLQFGDYSIEGYESRVAVERKSLDDLVGSMLSMRPMGWPRFSSRLAEFARLDFACVVVEATDADIRHRKYVPDIRSTRRLGPSAEWTKRLDKLTPAEILAAVAEVIITYRVPIYMVGPPTHAAAHGFKLLEKWHDRQKAKEAASE